MTNNKPHIAIFASGEGTNFAAIADAIDQNKISALLTCLITDQPHCKAIEKATDRKIPCLIVPFSQYAYKTIYETYILQHLKKQNVEWLILAGYMRIIGSTLLTSFKNKIINIHPSLLPAFPGKDAIQQAIQYGVKITGVTSHIVNEGIDTGPILEQKAYEIQPHDTYETIKKSLQQIEHTLYINTLQKIFTSLTK